MFVKVALVGNGEIWRDLGMQHQGASIVQRGNFQMQKLCRVTVPVKSVRKESGVLDLVYRKKVTASIVGQANMVVPQREPPQKLPA
tara:strand:- start:136 stop:393 length:258 start_codon:yes stop_codon:yes gene_type:complete